MTSAQNFICPIRVVDENLLDLSAQPYRAGFAIRSCRPNRGIIVLKRGRYVAERVIRQTTEGEILRMIVPRGSR